MLCLKNTEKFKTSLILAVLVTFLLLCRETMMKSIYKEKFTGFYGCRGIARDQDDKDHGSWHGDGAVPECLHPKHGAERVRGRKRWKRQSHSDRDGERKSDNWQLPILFKPQSLITVKHFLQGPTS